MLYTYDFKQVACILGGQILTGFAEGDDAIKVEYDNEEFGLTVGADGEATRSKSNNRSATVTLKFQKTSPSNDILNGFLQADRLSNGGIQPFACKDNNGREVHAAESMWIQKAPPASHGANAGTMEWVLRTSFMVSTFGGN